MILNPLRSRERIPAMNVMALRSKQVIRQDNFETPAKDVLPLHWSILIWLALAAASWAVVIYAASFLF